MKPVPVNNSPDLSMSEITSMLFDNEFLSDFTFTFDSYIICAHSMELMKRSSVFVDLVKSNTKELQFYDRDYHVIHEFVRFIYTDKCNVTDNNVVRLLRLAIDYKVIKLENMLIDYLCRHDCSMLIKLLNFCIESEYYLVLNQVSRHIAINLKEVLNSPALKDILPKTMETILKLGPACLNATQFEIFQLLVVWIKNLDLSMKIMNHELHRYIDLIDFTKMTGDQRNLCVRQNPELFSDQILANLYRIHAHIYIADFVFNREICGDPLQETPLVGEGSISTRFIVSKSLLLKGLYFGSSTSYNFFQIRISNRISSEVNCDTNFIYNINIEDDCAGVLNFEFVQHKNLNTCCISLGDSIELEPHLEYTVTVNFLPRCIENKPVSVYCRRPASNIHVHDAFAKFVTILEPGRNMLELLFAICDE